MLPNEFSKKAVDMLLKGATLVSEPCPYCKGVRVIKDGHAFCVSCGREPKVIPNLKEDESKSHNVLNTLEQKLEDLSKELEQEKDHEKQQQILKSINSLLEIIGKLKK